MGYLRSTHPNDITSLEPSDNLDEANEGGPQDFHLRMNVGLSKDGGKMALVVMTGDGGFQDADSPIMYIGHKGGDGFFNFEKPFQYVENNQAGLLTPQVVVGDDGIVVVSKAATGSREQTRLVQVSWDPPSQTEPHKVKPPVRDEIFDGHVTGVRPVDDNFGKIMMVRLKDDTYDLLVYRTYLPEFELNKETTIHAKEEDLGEGSSWVPLPEERYAVLTPKGGNVHAWTGDFKVEGGQPSSMMEFHGDIGPYMQVPNPIYGSLPAYPINCIHFGALDEGHQYVVYRAQFGDKPCRRRRRS